MSRVPAAMLAALCVIGTATPVAHAHKGNPNFRSIPTDVPEGISVEVTNFDDSLELTNRSGKTVVVMGYANEPYARIGADGTVEINQRSPATYENRERFGGVAKPAGVDPEATPQWKLVDRSGRFVWHDHRSHYMSKGTPPQVSDPDVRTKVFDWKVPIAVAGKPAFIAGTLFWQPVDDGGGAPLGAIIAFVALVALGATAIVVVRVRRRFAPTGSDEAW